MAVGDPDDTASRIRSLVPTSWLPSESPVYATIFAGAGAAFSWIYDLIGFAAKQTRRVTLSGEWLDLAFLDFFGRRRRRKPGQDDAGMRSELRREVLRRRNTRGAVERAVEDLTGQDCAVFEAFNAQDTGGFSAGWAFNEPTSRFGSDAYPRTMFLDVVQPMGAGVPLISGFSSSYSGFVDDNPTGPGSPWSGGFSGGFGGPTTPIVPGSGSYFGLVELDDITGAVTPDDIYDTINGCRSAGITCWVRLGPPEIAITRVGVDFKIGESRLR